jgi:hypothetical protein
MGQGPEAGDFLMQPHPLQYHGVGHIAREADGPWVVLKIDHTRIG